MISGFYRIIFTIVSKLASFIIMSAERSSLPQRVEPLVLPESDAVQRVDLTVLPGEVLGAVSQHFQVSE